MRFLSAEKDRGDLSKLSDGIHNAIERFTVRLYNTTRPVCSDTVHDIQVMSNIKQLNQLNTLIVRTHIIDVHYRLIVSVATLYLQRKAVSDLLSLLHC